jgi:hypothetical protein
MTETRSGNSDRLPMTMRIPTGLRPLLFVAPLLAGCGDGRPSLVPATGQVLLNGAPLAGATVSFQPVDVAEGSFQRPSRATTDAEGRFSPTTYSPGDGIPVGKYRVAVQKREPVGELPPDFNWETADDAAVKFQWTTPRKYSSPDTSGLEVEVTGSGLQPDVLNLTSDGPPEIEQSGPQGPVNEA